MILYDGGLIDRGPWVMPRWAVCGGYWTLCGVRSFFLFLRSFSRSHGNPFMTFFNFFLSDEVFSFIESYKH